MNSKSLSKTTQITGHITTQQKQAQQSRKQYMQEKIKLWKKLKNQGLDDLACAKICNISHATLYRYKKRITDLENGIPLPTRARLQQNQPKWGEPEEQIVSQVRRQSPTFGKKKITVILNRDYNKCLSVSTVGRIITLLLAAGIIQKSRAAPTARRRQVRNGYAQRKPFKEYSKATIGEDIQIDHTTITINGRTYKPFQAWDRCSKLLFSYLYSDAKSATAKRFLKQMIKTTPFKIKSIQVDGGSEFRGKFEQACASLNIPLFVISPDSQGITAASSAQTEPSRRSSISKPKLRPKTSQTSDANSKKSSTNTTTSDPATTLQDSPQCNTFKTSISTTKRSRNTADLIRTKNTQRYRCVQPPCEQ